MTYLIESKRIGLRDWRESDLPRFAEINSDPHVMEFFPGLLAEEESNEVATRIRKHIRENGFGLWAADLKSSNEFIGFVGLSVPRFEAFFTPCVEIGWRLSYKHWGQGYASEAARECLRFGFESLKLDSIVSFTSILNLRSIAVMKKIGMNYISEFNHPLVEDGNRLKRHVLYELSAASYRR